MGDGPGRGRVGRRRQSFEPWFGGPNLTEVDGGPAGGLPARTGRQESRVGGSRQATVSSARGERAERYNDRDAEADYDAYWPGQWPAATRPAGSGTGLAHARAIASPRAAVSTNRLWA